MKDLTLSLPKCADVKTELKALKFVLENSGEQDAVHNRQYCSVGYHTGVFDLKGKMLKPHCASQNKQPHIKLLQTQGHTKGGGQGLVPPPLEYLSIRPELHKPANLAIVDAVTEIS